MEKLYLQGNSLLAISSLKLPIMTEINLSGNRLAELDRSLFESKKLTSLDMSKNPLTTLPDDMFDMFVNLKTLNMADTKLRKVPKFGSVMLNSLEMDNVPLQW